MKELFYLDLNIQIWQDLNGVYFYSVMQETAEDAEPTKLSYGQADTHEDIMELVREAVRELI